MSSQVSDQIYVFSSHAWKYGHRRDGLHDLLQPTWVKGVDYHDLSVTSRHPLHTVSDRDLAAELQARIARTDVFLIMAGMYVYDRFWMEFEIITAFNYGIPIVPVAWNGQERIPDLATRFASCEPVRWRGESLREAIFAQLSADRRDAFLWRRAAAAYAMRRRLGLPILGSVLGGAAVQPSTPVGQLPGGLLALARALSNDQPPSPSGLFGRRLR